MREDEYKAETADDPHNTLVFAFLPLIALIWLFMDFSLASISATLITTGLLLLGLGNTPIMHHSVTLFMGSRQEDSPPLGEGWYWLFPGLYSTIPINMDESVLVVPGKDGVFSVITKANPRLLGCLKSGLGDESTAATLHDGTPGVEFDVRVAIHWQVKKANAIFNIIGDALVGITSSEERRKKIDEVLDSALVNLAKNAIRSMAAREYTDETFLSSQEDIASKLAEKIQEKTDEWGIHVHKIVLSKAIPHDESVRKAYQLLTEEEHQLNAEQREQQGVQARIEEKTAFFKQHGLSEKEAVLEATRVVQTERQKVKEIRITGSASDLVKAGTLSGGIDQTN